MGWKAVASMSEQDLKEQLGMPKKKEEPQKDKDKPDEEQQVGGKGSNVNNGAGRSSGSGGVQPVIPPDPDLDPDLDLDPEEAELSWSERIKARREEKKRERTLNKAMKEAQKEEFKRAFRDKYHGDTSLLDRLALKFPKLGKFLGKDFSRLFDKELSFDERLEEALRGLPQEERDAKAAEGLVKNLERTVNQIKAKMEKYEASARRKIKDAIEERRQRRSGKARC